MKNKTIVRIGLITATILCIPIIGMQVSNEWNWTLFDFVWAGTLIAGTQCAYEFAVKRMKNATYKLAVGLALLAAFLLMWINGAVGIIGDGPVNMIYLGVIVIGFFGAIITRLKPQGMSRVLFAMAIAQTLIPVIALSVWGREIDWSPSMLGVFVLNGFFVMLFIGSALLFQQASALSKESKL
jgi:hypothetical protein